MKRTRHSKLSLHRETLQKLGSAQLAEIQGGGSAVCTVNCGTTGCNTSGACPAESNNCTTGSAGCNLT
jgi:hypothetical protein